MSVELGKLIDGERERDAIHVAIAPVVAAERLAPGQDVGFVDPEHSAQVGVVPAGKAIGIVDPFLSAMVPKGEKFWLCLYPNTVTGMRHHWRHPTFDFVSTAPADSEAWLRDFADRAGICYAQMIEIVKSYAETGDPWTQMGSSRVQDTFDEEDEDEFWRHFENVTGVAKPDEGIVRFGSPFSCSC